MMGRNIQFFPYAAQLGAAGLALAFLMSPAQAVTCEEVRGLTPTELTYWAKRLKVTPAKLAALLAISFCVPWSESPPLIASNHRKRLSTAE